MDKEYFDKRIKEPFNDAWSCLQPIRDSNSDEAWTEYMIRQDHLYKRLSKAATPYEFEFLRLLHKTVLSAADMIGKSYKEGSDKSC